METKRVEDFAHHSKTQRHSPKDNTGHPCPEERAFFRYEASQASATAAVGSDWFILTQSQPLLQQH